MEAAAKTRGSGATLAFLYCGIALFPLAGVVLAPIPVAVAIARGRAVAASGFVVLAGACMAIGFGTLAGAPLGLLAGCIGAAIGHWIGQGRPFGALAMRATALAIVFNLGVLAAQWDMLGETLRQSQIEFEELLRNTAGAEESEYVDAVVESNGWFLDHWRFLLPGLTAVVVMFCTCMSLALTSRWLRLNGGPSVEGAFRTMRPPDWLVWVAIACAGVWFIDQQWPVDGLRMVGWNLAIMLAGVYWLNGLGVLLSMVESLKVHPFFVALFAVSLVLSGLLRLLPLLGLFDTWGEFRQRIQKLVEARESRDESDDEY